MDSLVFCLKLKLTTQWTVQEGALEHADAIGNHAGKEIFGEETFTFWILFDQANYIIPNSGNYDFEAHIMCTEI